MSLASVSIKKPVFAWMLMLALMLFGLISFKGMGVGQMPDVDFPVLNVNIAWEGAAPEVMETDVVDIVEDAVMGIEGLRNITSSTKQGQADITLEFDLGRDVDVALQETQSKLSEAQRRLPAEIDPPVIIKINPEDQPIMWVAVSSDRPRRELMEYVDVYLKDKFKTIPGVGEVFLGGYIERNLRVWIDTNKLALYQLTVDDVIEAIQSEHTEIPAGQLETDQKEYSVRVMGEALNTKDFGKIMINYRGGQPMYRPIPLTEVASIEDGLSDVRRISRVLGKPAVGLGIRKQSGANSVKVAREVKKKMNLLRNDLPKGYSIGVNFDSTQFIEDAVDELVFTLILSAILTSLVCWIFLGSWSSTLNILLAIPTSLLGTFFVLKFANFTLNTFTLLGLSLAIGIVVDDAIMILENIVRHRQLGESQHDAALKGTTEITLAAVVATTAVIAIFLPVAFMQGVIGKFFFQFGVTTSVAVLISLLEALSFAPMRCSQFLEMGERKTKFGKFFEQGMEDTRELYRKILVVVLRKRKMVVLSAGGFFILSLLIIPFLRKEFVPVQDQGMFIAQLQTPIGSSLEFTSGRFKLAEEVTMKRQEVNRYYAAIGGFGGGEVNKGILFITLKPLKERRDPVTGKHLSQLDLMDYFRKELNKIPDLKATLQDLSTRGLAADRGFPVEFSIQGPEWEKLAEHSTAIQEAMKKSPLFQDVDSNYLEGMPEVRIYPNRDKAFQHGTSIRSIARTINALIAGTRVAKYTKGGRRYDVRVRVENDQRMTPKDLENILVRNNRGELVKLTDLVDFKERKTLLNITRENRERAIKIFANVGKGQSQGSALQKAEEISRAILPEGYHMVLSGTSRSFRESFGSLMFAFWLGIVISYMILASQFNHVIHPFTVLLALPFSISGAFIALAIGGYSLNIFSLIGLLLLMGIVKKNSILLVEFTNQLREQGLSPLEAIKQACPIRFRPIIMTSVSTIAAAVPPALALGPGAETRVPMAMAVIGGVLVSTVLTLVVVPCAYYMLVPYEDPKLWRDAFVKGWGKFLRGHQTLAKWITGLTSKIRKGRG